MRVVSQVVFFLILALPLWAESSGFVRCNGSHFEVGGLPYYFVGTNVWYAPILGSKNKKEGGDRDRLCRELDLLASKGVNNLRIMVGADGRPGVKTRVEPMLQLAPGKYNDDVLDGLDFLMAEMGKRKMYAVLYINNSWEWSGGYSQYLNWAGAGTIPIPALDGWAAYTDYVKQFARNERAIGLFKDHVLYLISRKNRYTGLNYTDDPALMSWQISNEPRAFSSDNKEAFVKWMGETAALIRSLDKNHLISTGSEGSKGSENDIDLWRKIHADPNIDYLTIHAWPNNWRWIDRENIPATTGRAIANVMEYIFEHAAVAQGLDKPIVLEEFGMPRDHFRFDLSDTTGSRDALYRTVFEYILNQAQTLGSFAGCNFWAWGGWGRPTTGHVFWERWDNYLGDPAQEEQGLNSVFDTDTTIGIIEQYARRLREVCVEYALPIDRRATPETAALLRNMKRLSKCGFMFGHQDATLYGIGWKYDSERSDVKSISGKYPAVYGWEIGDVELGTKEVSLDSIHFDRIRQEIRSAYRRGGVNTISWHANNPITGGNSWDKEPVGAVESVLPNGKNHRKFQLWLDRVADFLLSLTDDDGRLIPVVFRVWHEHTGGWFWWGNQQCTAEQYNALFRYTVEYLRDRREVHNLLWGFSPSTIKNEAEFLERYPGDGYVDLIGIDVYQGGKESNSDYIAKLKRGAEVVCGIVRSRNKVAALTEMGCNLVPDSHWWTEVMYLALKGFSMAYGLVWRNAFERPDHYFGPYPGHRSADDFLIFTRLPRVIMESELPQMYK